MGLIIKGGTSIFPMREKPPEANQRYRSIQSPVHKPLEMVNGPLPQPTDPRNLGTPPCVFV